MAPSRDIARLIEVMAALRTPDTGCPWDLRQDFASIAPYTIEEAYEVADAINRGDLDDLRHELGDLLLQVVYHARMAEEAGAFAFGDVVQAITAKMITRHPHVFGDLRGADEAAVQANWRLFKEAERAGKAQAATPAGVLAGVALALPALTRAHKIQERARDVGFDWPDMSQVFDKVREEVDEVAQELAGKSNKIGEEIGDLLFAVVNLARHAGVDAEQTLKAATGKFERRFAGVEMMLAARGLTPRQSTLEHMEELWNEVKAGEKSPDVR
ncbi:nucleoside triphosphate pyrophosphohydrolase [Candidatus Raskinella chloraquaticus]|jgi:nucleoside triphosphate diphosphatase|uniref:Nucleoside triphosphate pyrophosphohydrolase n=1 Tax=Candidatus Raskinella chloraquaticus TaxID=1951219 RepID=A0A1W9HZZ1_9HYPH|nr:MAG: nucleoside triphosphate pyrophosphohydrolase [Proteobacteria bacterium SG_bin8]